MFVKNQIITIRKKQTTYYEIKAYNRNEDLPTMNCPPESRDKKEIPGEKLKEIKQMTPALCRCHFV